MSEKTVIVRYEEYLRYEKESSENSIKAYLADILLFISFIELNPDSFNVADVSRGDIRSWIMTMSESGVSARSINRRVTALNGLFKWSLSNGLVSKNPVSMVKKMKETRYVPSFIREDEMNKILEDTSAELTNQLQETSPIELYERVLTYTIILVLYTTGLRKSELLNLRISDLDFKLKTITATGKGNKQRIIPIIPQLESALALYEDEKKNFLGCEYDKIYVFLYSDGKQLNYYHLLKMVKSVLQSERIQGKLSPHLLRHTFASHLLRAGAEITAIKELLGHSSLVTTQIYTHNTVEELKEAYMKAHPRAKEK